MLWLVFLMKWTRRSNDESPHPHASCFSLINIGIVHVVEKGAPFSLPQSKLRGPTSNFGDETLAIHKGLSNSLSCPCMPFTQKHNEHIRHSNDANNFSWSKWINVQNLCSEAVTSGICRNLFCFGWVSGQSAFGPKITGDHSCCAGSELMQFWSAMGADAGTLNPWSCCASREERLFVLTAPVQKCTHFESAFNEGRWDVTRLHLAKWVMWQCNCCYHLLLFMVTGRPCQAELARPTASKLAVQAQRQAALWSAMDSVNIFLRCTDDVAEDGFTVTGETKAESVLMSDSIVWREHALCNWQRDRDFIGEKPRQSKIPLPKIRTCRCDWGWPKGDRTKAPIERAFQKWLFGTHVRLFHRAFTAMAKVSRLHI